MGLSAAVDSRQGFPQAPAGRVAIFDLDRTLIPGSSLVPYGKALVERRLIDVTMLIRHLGSAAVVARRSLGERRVDRIRSSLLSQAAGREYEPLAACARDVGRDLAAQVHPTARWLVDRHVAAGDFCVVLSASIHELVEAVAGALGAQRGIGTRTMVRDGTVTGDLDGPFCHGHGKLARLRSVLGDVDLASAVAYADSASDLPLLESSGEAIAVNPDRRLASVARSRGWATVRFP